ncbi:MAG: FmdB family zinc ribbon protein [Bdellovibrionota bacterium]
MPLYKYECQSCKTVTEFLLKISDSDPTDCPECNANAESNMIKIPARTSFILKGTGWYETDFKNSSKKDTNTSSSSNVQDASKQNGSETSGSDNTQKQNRLVRKLIQRIAIAAQAVALPQLQTKRITLQTQQTRAC